MKLFKFPVLVFDNIIIQLDSIPLVSLSFCSKKTRERIKRVSFAIKDAWFANEFGKEPGYFFEVKFPSQQCLYVNFRATRKEFKKWAKNFNVQIGDITYCCRYPVEEQEANRNDFFLDCTGYKKAIIFFNYILDLVRAEINEIWINLNRLVDIKQLISEPCFKKIQKIRLIGKSVPAKKVFELYECFNKPLLETIVESQIKPLSPTSKVLQSESLKFPEAKYISIEHLLAFSGKYIVLDFSSLLEEHLISFVKHWLDGKFPNLVGAYISCPMESVFETEKVLNEFNTKRWNPAERAQSFIFKASFSGDEKRGFPIRDCSNGNDLERSDGLMATMQFEEHDFAFNFFVWHTRFP